MPDAASPSTRPARYQVVGIGNALVDVIAHATDDFLVEHGLVKGSMTLIDTERAVELYRALGAAVEMSGGSAANTMCGIASFGGRAAYIGKVSGDDLGAVFGHDLHAVGVAFRPGAPSADVPTGRCIIVVTPDAQRTMNTYLGVSSLLCVVRPRRSRRSPTARCCTWRATCSTATMPRPPSAAPPTSPTAPAGGCRSRCRTRSASTVTAPTSGPSSATRSTSCSATRTSCARCTRSRSLDEAIASVRRECPLVAVTAGAEGSYVVTPDGTVRVAAEHVDRVLDTTGAGDLYAAGFLHGLTNGESLHDCARLGSIAAAEVISHVGPRPLVELRTLVG